MESTTPKNVWLVDDEQDVLTYLSVALEDEDLEARGFQAADGILDEATREPPDLFCLDIMMPSQSGLSLYRDLRQDAKLREIPVIIVSAYSGAREFLGTEFRKLVDDDTIPAPDGFIEKPVDLGKFIGLVQELVSPREEASG